jgi:hypothetical protein
MPTPHAPVSMTVARKTSLNFLVTYSPNSSFRLARQQSRITVNKECFVERNPPPAASTPSKGSNATANNAPSTPRRRPKPLLHRFSSHR